MMPKRTTGVDSVPIRVVIVTMDDHLTGTIMRMRPQLKREIPGLILSAYSAADWGRSATTLEACKKAIGEADLLMATMMFMEDQFTPILPALRARRESCDAFFACLSAPEVTRLTRMGSYDMGQPASGFTALLKRLRGNTKPGQNAGASQLKMLRRLPRILKFIPGTAQDVRAFFLGMQYWLAGSDDNFLNMIRFMVNRYASGPRAVYRGTLKAADPVEYPETGVYHPRMKARMSETDRDLPGPPSPRGTVGLLVMRSYLLAGNTAHYDAVIAAIEARGYRVIPAFASGLDARPAIEHFFVKNGAPMIDALVSLTGFSLVGGPAYNDAAAAAVILKQLDVPYIAAHAVEFQSLQEWGGSDRGLMPVEATIMVAIPELDGATGSMVFGGRIEAGGATCTGCHRKCQFAADQDARAMVGCPERIDMLAARVDRLVSLRRTERASRKIGIVIFNFPPNAGSIGSAAYLAVFESLHHTLKGLRKAGYRVDVPASVDDLRKALVEGNAAMFGANANVHCRIPASDHVRRERWLGDIERQWGPAPGRHQSDGSNIFVLGASFGNVFVGIQPAFGYEGDPMRLLFEKGFAPTHAFSAFYRWLREDFGAQALLHFGTHGALEFMPGKHTGLSGSSWPDRLIGDMPNIYLYASNNPSEGSIAKRRSAATLITYLTPPVAHAGLYRGLLDLKASLDRWRSMSATGGEERLTLAALIQAQAATVDLATAEPAWGETAHAEISKLSSAVLELEYTLIPHGLHVVGAPMSRAERADMLLAVADASHGKRLDREIVEAIVDRKPLPSGIDAALAQQLSGMDRLLEDDHELPAILHALDGGFTPPAQGGDVLRSPAVLPTGRNMHGFDPFRIPSVFAMADGRRQAAKLLARHVGDGHAAPEKVAMVLWGADNVKTEGGPIGQALALIGAEPRFDHYGRLTGAELVPLADLGRPRIDVVLTLSGIFRDLLPLQTKLLAEACFLAASADEPEAMNFVRRNTLAYQREQGCDFETAALRVFSNADGAYGSNVNHLIENGQWDNGDELAETYCRRKSFAYGRDGAPQAQTKLLTGMLSRVDLAYQNLESMEVGVTSLDQYFDTLGGISKAAQRAKGTTVPVYIGDQTRSEGVVRTLGEQVSLEARTRILNPKWFEGMLKHGYEGVRQIEEHVRNTVGWSATTGQVEPWVYKQMTQTLMLDPELRERLIALNPVAASKVARRLIEAQQRNYWTPDAATAEALLHASEDLEDRLEGIGNEVAA
jgi:magnesium chelatase subunit H